MNVANATVLQTADWEAVKGERDGKLRQIARAGKQWKHTIGRTVDMEGSFVLLPLGITLSIFSTLTYRNSLRLPAVLGVREALGGRSRCHEFRVVMCLFL